MRKIRDTRFVLVPFATVDAMDMLALIASAFFAGLIDSMVGGGGLIQLPALLNIFPTTPIPVLFGTNKFASCFGTGVAATYFIRKVDIPWHEVIGAAVAAFLFSFLGARSVSLLDPSILRPLIIILLTAVLAYTLVRKDIGSTHSPKRSKMARAWIGIGIGSALGFYDGFLGPGTGSFLIFAFVTLLGFDFLRASASAKIINLSTNAAALAYFIPSGNVRYDLGIGMALANICGSYLGALLATSRGVSLVRIVFVFVVTALIIRLSWITFAG